MKRIIKDYKKWMGVKSKLNNSGPRRSIKEGEIWWAAMGENVGVEIDGKNEKYSRPVIIFKKHSNLCFTAIPLTSKKHNGSWYAQFGFQEKNQTAILIQARLMDSTRLYERMGKMSNGDFWEVTKRYLELFKPKNMPQS